MITCPFSWLEKWLHVVLVFVFVCQLYLQFPVYRALTEEHLVKTVITKSPLQLPSLCRGGRSDCGCAELICQAGLNHNVVTVVTAPLSGTGTSVTAPHINRTVLQILWLGHLIILPALEGPWCNGARNACSIIFFLRYYERKEPQSRAWKKMCGSSQIVPSR